MNVDLLFPAFPPQLDGIGDYTAQLAAQLATDGCSVRVFTAQSSPSPVDGVEVRPVLGPGRGLNQHSLAPAVDAMIEDPADWLIVQYNPFSYGKYGWAAEVVREIKRLRTHCPSLRIAVMAHESFVDVADFRQNASFAIMTLWQRLHFRRLGRLADAVFLSTEPRAKRFASWFPNAQVHHLPVGSNIPLRPVSEHQARAAFDLPQDAFIVGLFGTAHVTRLLPAVREAMLHIQEIRPNSLLLYVGPHGDTMREVFRGLPMVDAGKLPAEDVSTAFQAMNLYLAPFERGVSTRRGSFLTGLQHGIPTASTVGPDTGPLLRAHNGHAFVLSETDDVADFGETVRSLLSHTPGPRSPLSLQRVGTRGQALYRELFDWPAISAQLRAVLAGSSNAPFAPNADAAPSGPDMTMDSDIQPSLSS